MKCKDEMLPMNGKDEKLNGKYEKLTLNEIDKRVSVFKIQTFN